MGQESSWERALSGTFPKLKLGFVPFLFKTQSLIRHFQQPCSHDFRLFVYFFRDFESFKRGLIFTMFLCLPCLSVMLYSLSSMVIVIFIDKVVSRVVRRIDLLYHVLLHHSLSRQASYAFLRVISSMSFEGRSYRNESTTYRP